MCDLFGDLAFIVIFTHCVQLPTAYTGLRSMKRRATGERRAMVSRVRCGKIVNCSGMLSDTATRWYALTGSDPCALTDNTPCGVAKRPALGIDCWRSRYRPSTPARSRHPGHQQASRQEAAVAHRIEGGSHQQHRRKLSRVQASCVELHSAAVGRSHPRFEWQSPHDAQQQITANTLGVNGNEVKSIRKSALRTNIKMAKQAFARGDERAACGRSTSGSGSSEHQCTLDARSSSASVGEIRWS
ncbi:hypothetical protein U1Q18_044834 [Sarracenia purpurea var. burkii]